MNINFVIYSLMTLLTFTYLPFFSNGQNREDKNYEGVEVKKIWDKAPYNAFTDLIRFKGSFYCTFREGSGHVPGKKGWNGEIRIITSKTGSEWKSVALLKKENIDLRDPKLSITPDGRLMIICGGSVYKGDSLLGRYPQVSFSNLNGTNFSSPEKVNLASGIKSDYAWIWRVTWHNDVGYGIDYQTDPAEKQDSRRLFLVSTRDGKNYTLVHTFHIDGFPNESTVRFDKEGKMYVLIRRELLGNRRGLLVVSAPPYSDWTFHQLAIRLGGPDFIFPDQKQLIIGTRTYEGDIPKTTGTHTGILLTDLKGKIDSYIQLKSGNDTGYPGLVKYNDTLWVSYYSNHLNDHHTSIYLAKIPLRSLKKQ
jgi:hypothetical protein